MPVALLFTAMAMVAFAANSLLARAALGGALIDAISFTAIRLIAGAASLSLLLLATKGGFTRRSGNWGSALALLAYALAFSLAYLRLDAATGALILFASVQGTMIGIGLARGDRPASRETIGLVVAAAAFIYLLLPGLRAPDLTGGALMMVSGIAWGFYSLRGRGSSDPLGDTAGNFIRSALIMTPLALTLLPVLPGSAAFHNAPSGIGLAVVSGALTSGIGYAIWYRALPALTTTQAATVQLTVPIIAAIGAVALLSETLTSRLVIASIFILGGVALAILSKRP